MRGGVTGLDSLASGRYDAGMNDPKENPAVALGKLRWAGTTKAERSEAMSALAKRRAKKLTKAKRTAIAAMGGAATKGKPRKPGAGRPRKKPG